MHRSTAVSDQPRDLTSAAYWEKEWDGLGIAGWSARSPQPVRRSRRKGRPLMRFLSGLIDEHETQSPDVIEIGCAPGGILGELHRWRPAVRLHGLDYAEQGLANTARLLAHGGVPATLHCGELREFDPGRKYDLVYSCGLVEHFSDPVPILAHHARLCRPGGRVVVTVPNYSGPWQTWLIARLSPETLESHNTEIMSAASLQELMSRAGLAEVDSGEFGFGRFYTRCSVRNWRTHSLRLAAKTWNAARRVVPLTPNWHCTVWATGCVRDAHDQLAA